MIGSKYEVGWGWGRGVGVGVDEGVRLGFERHHLAAFSLFLLCILAEIHGCLGLDVGVVRAI